MLTLCLGDEMLPTVAPLRQTLSGLPASAVGHSLRRLSAVLAASSLALAEDANNLPTTGASCRECLRIRVGRPQSRVTCQDTRLAYLSRNEAAHWSISWVLAVGWTKSKSPWIQRSLPGSGLACRAAPQRPPRVWSAQVTCHAIEDQAIHLASYKR
jgi:hypothetical protein